MFRPTEIRRQPEFGSSDGATISEFPSPAVPRKPRYFPALMGRLLKSEEVVDARMEIGEYGEIMMQILAGKFFAELIAEHIRSKPGEVVDMRALRLAAEDKAHKSLSAERVDDIVAYEGRAADLFAHQRRLTVGPGAISMETYQHALDTNPKAVLADSERWAVIRNERNAAMAGAAVL